MPVSKEDEDYWAEGFADSSDGHLTAAEEDLIARATRLWDARDETSLAKSGFPQSVADRMDMQRIVNLVIVKRRSMK